MFRDFLTGKAGDDCNSGPRRFAILYLKIARRHLYEYILQYFREFPKGHTVTNENADKRLQEFAIRREQAES